MLQPLIQQLMAEVQRRGVAPPKDLPEALRQVIAVDGTFFTLTREVMWAAQHGYATKGWGKGRKRGGRVDVHWDVGHGLPVVVNVHGCDTSEAENAVKHVQPGAIHLYDRGIFSFELLAEHNRVQAWFVSRMRTDGPRCPKIREEKIRLLTTQDEAAGVVSDRLISFCGSQHTTPPEGTFREVIVRDASNPSQTVRLITNLLDVAAWVIAALYRQRWQVELFFRWLKIYAHFLKPLTYSKAGMQLQLYVAVVAILLIYLRLGVPPSKAAYTLFTWYLQGLIGFEELSSPPNAKPPKPAPAAPAPNNYKNKTYNSLQT